MESLAKLTCPSCKRFGCDCEICAICRRNKKRCICTSSLTPPELAETKSGDPVPGRTIERKADLDMVHYFNRDAAGLRKRLVEQHTEIAALRERIKALEPDGSGD